MGTESVPKSLQQRCSGLSRSPAGQHRDGVFLSPRVPVYSGIVAVSVAWCAGCSLRITQAEMKFLETRELRAPYHEVYDAAINAIFSMGMTVQHSDKASGVISGQSGDHVQRANARWRRNRYDVKKVTLLVRPKGPRRTQVRMKVLVNERQRLDRKLMTAIWQRIEREALLESPPLGPRPARTAGRP